MAENKKNGKGLKATKWKVGGTIAVAMLTAWITYINNKSASDDELKKTIVKQEAIVNELNTGVIPAIQRRLDQLQQDYKELGQDESAARERIAKLEGILEALLRKVKIKDIIVPAFSTRAPEKESNGILKVLGLGKKKKEKPKKKSAKIPTLQVQQRILPNLDSPIITKEKRND
jgi:hypothetical protein